MSAELLLSIAGVFAGVAVVCGAVLSLVLERTSVEQRRLHALVAPPSLDAAAPAGDAHLADAADPALQKLTRALPRSPKDMSRLRKRMASAGYYDLKAAVAYSFAELLIPVGFAAAVLLALPLKTGWIFACLAAGVGYVLPGVWLERRISLRKKAIQNGLPDALDLFIVCMEAGSSLDQAIVKASTELEITHPALTQELRFLTTEIRAGKPRLEAFQNLARRTGVDDVRSLVAMLVQTDRFGTSVAQALRTHASNSRTKRRQQAEERAQKVGVKLVFPLVLFLFPGVYVVCLGPVVVLLYRNLIS